MKHYGQKLSINANLDAEVRELTKDLDEEKTRIDPEVANREKEEERYKAAN